MKPAELFDQNIAKLGDWRGVTLTKLRQVIESSEPELIMEWKWGTAVWEHNGLVCAISAFRDHVKINFFQGALLPDPHQLFNSGLDSKLHRSINYSKDDKINAAGLKALLHSAVAHNTKG